MITALSAPQSEELTRLELLRSFKKHFAGDGEMNRSPFADGQVVRYHTDVQAWDVPDIHHQVREAAEQTLRGIHQGNPSSVVILAGEPGMGKSHLLNCFRSPKRADELGYVLVCNSNHWKVNEFEECLLDWILEALVRPSPDEPHLLLDKIKDVAFQALGQILARPGQLRKFLGKDDAGFLRRMWARLTGNQHGRFQQALEARDVAIFRRLDFSRFAGYVCDRFLRESGNPFHRYVLRVLLRYLFPEDREKTLHWLRRKTVPAPFLQKLGAEEAIDRHYKVMDTIKILISLFTPEVARGLNPSPEAGGGKVFFFAFDQMEGRQELFEKDEDWFKFFAQLSELYNALPNVFILFTMTLGLRDRLYPKMERQFQQRIRRDQKFVLREMQDEEILSVYRRRIDCWLGEDLPEPRKLLEDVRFRYLPFDQKAILDFSRQKVLREILQTMDFRFRQYLIEEVLADDPRSEYLTARNEFRQKEEEDSPFRFTEEHLIMVTELMNRAGGFLATAFGMAWGGLEARATDDQLPALRLEFRLPDQEEMWVRVFLVRLPFRFNPKLDGCFNLIFRLQTDRNFLWMLRPERVDNSWESRRPGQVFARVLPSSTEADLRAMLVLLKKLDNFQPNARVGAEKILLEEFKLTYLGEMFQQATETLEALKSRPGGPPAPAANA